MKDDSELLKDQLDVNDRRFRKLEEHKKSVELQLKNPKSDKELVFLLETLKRLEYNLQIECKQRNGILKAINSQPIFK